MLLTYLIVLGSTRKSWRQVTSQRSMIMIRTSQSSNKITNFCQSSKLFLKFCHSFSHPHSLKIKDQLKEIEFYKEMKIRRRQILPNITFTQTKKGRKLNSVHEIAIVLENGASLIDSVLMKDINLLTDNIEAVSVNIITPEVSNVGHQVVYGHLLCLNDLINLVTDTLLLSVVVVADNDDTNDQEYWPHLVWCEDEQELIIMQPGYYLTRIGPDNDLDQVLLGGV